MRRRVAFVGSLAWLVACGSSEGGIEATPGEVATPVAHVECIGAPADTAPIAALCGVEGEGTFFYPMTWYRTDDGGIEVDIGDETARLEIIATLPAKYDPESDFSHEVSYRAYLVHDTTRDELTGSLVTETLVPSCNGGRFRAGGQLEWENVTLDLFWEAYPEAACDTGGTGGGGTGGFFGTGGGGGAGGAGGGT